MFTPSSANQKSFSKAFQVALLFQGGTVFSELELSCKIVVKFLFPKPKNHYIINLSSKKPLLFSSAPTLLTKVPDRGNCVKVVVDALQNSCYKNDCPVVKIDVSSYGDVQQPPKGVQGRPEWRGVYPDGYTLIWVTKIDDHMYVEGCSCVLCKIKKTAMNEEPWQIIGTMKQW